MAENNYYEPVASDLPLDMNDKDSLDKEFNSFCRNLETIQAKVLNEWTEQWTEDLRSKAIDFEKSVSEYEAHINTARQSIADQKVRADEIKELTEKLQKLETAKTDLKLEVEEKRKKISEENAKLKDCAKDVDALEKVTNAKKDKVLKALSFFKERLGLEFITLKAEDQIKVTFTRVDLADCDREFSFRTKIVNSKYIISECEPSLAQLDMYTAELNASNDFGRFIIKMRKAFRNTMKTENNQNISVNIL